MNVTFWGMNPLSLPEKEEKNLRKYIKKVHPNLDLVNEAVRPLLFTKLNNLLN